MINQINFKKTQSQVQKLIFSYTKENIKHVLKLQKLKGQEMKSSFVTLLSACLIHQTLPLPLKLFRQVFNALAREGKWKEEDGKAVRLPSYSIFVRWYHRLGPWVEKIAQDELLKRRKKAMNQGPCLMMVDSTLLPINSGKGWSKSLKYQASAGYSSCGKAYGFKLHMLGDERGHPLAVHLDTASIHDLEGLKSIHQQQAIPRGILLADRGYISKAYYFELMQKNTILAVRPKENMEEGNDKFWFEYSIKTWPQKYKNIYRKRQNIEHEFSYLKHRLNMNVQGVKTFHHVLTKVFSALLVRLLHL